MSAKPVPTKFLEEISMDVVGPLPSSSAGNKYVLVIQNRLSRYIAFISMKNQTAEFVARYFLVEWACKYGAPKKLITDRGSNFMSTVFAQLCKFLGTMHSPTCAYRPQGNAENEQSHQQLHAYIAMYTDEASAELGFIAAVCGMGAQYIRAYRIGKKPFRNLNRTVSSKHQRNTQARRSRTTI
jgi:transposase InsO family protein